MDLFKNKYNFLKLLANDVNEKYQYLLRLYTIIYITIFINNLK